MTTIHKPSRLQAILFFIFSLLVAGAVFVWAVFLNKGTLTVTGSTPFTIKASTDSYDCPASPCTIQLTPRSYKLIVQKTGYFDTTPEVKIKRWHETAIAVDFQFIPTLKNSGDVVLPYPSAPLRPPFLGQKRLSNFPKNVKAAIFSHSGEKAIITLGKEIYIYDVTAHTVTETAISPSMVPAWLAEEIIYLDKSEDRQNLMKWTDENPQILVSFQRPFESARLFGAPSGKKILIENIIDGAVSYYLIDVEKRSRDKLSLPPQTVSAKWIGDYLIFKTNKRIFAMNPDTLQETDLPATTIENIITAAAPETVIMITSAKQDPSSNIGPSISEVMEEVKKESFNGKLTAGVLYLTELNIATHAGKTLLEIPMGEPGAKNTIRNLTADKNWKKLYFTMTDKDGEKLYEVALEK